MSSINVDLLNVTSPVGFTDAGLDALRALTGVKSVKALPDADGRYRDVWLHVTAEFNRAAFELAQRDAS